MEVILRQKPKNPTIIQGFPGIGLVGTIATEFLLEHLQAEQIGRVNVEEMPAAVAIHGGKVVDPFGIFYNKKHNLMVVHAITPSHGFEWQLADALLDIAKQTSAQEIICLEGVAGSNPEVSGTYFYTKDKQEAERLKKAGLVPMTEGIIIGVTGGLLLKAKDIPITCIFSETHTNLPDSKAAAGIIKALDAAMDLEVNEAPLLKQAEMFEAKLQQILKKGAEAAELSDKKKMSYVG
ncbi:proteasome assembly chaperone family protein [Candidatus Woesearchaeota archaeon]|nr:proteasome assembly chaperone family protein [Candidatus Woesearchaeota archaeon]